MVDTTNTQAGTCGYCGVPLSRPLGAPLSRELLMDGWYCSAEHQEIAHLQRDYAQMKAAAGAANVRAERAEDSLEECQRQRDAIVAEAGAAHAEVERLKRENVALCEDVSVARQSLYEVAEQREHLLRDIKALRARVAALESTCRSQASVIDQQGKTIEQVRENNTLGAAALRVSDDARRVLQARVAELEGGNTPVKSLKG